MNDGYVAGNFDWVGRIDGNDYNNLRWHQVVEKINIEKDLPVKRGFCLIGFKSDLGVKRNYGRIGAKQAPDTIRKYLSSMPWHFGSLGLYDAGNVVCDNDLEKSQEVLSHIIRNIMHKGLFPVVIGGGHESAFGSISGVYEKLKKMPSIINFDAHFDMRDYSKGATSGTSFKQIADVCTQNNETFKYMCIGIQKSANTIELFNTATSYKAKWVDTDMIRFNEKSAIKTIDGFVNDSDNIHLSICMDVFAQNIASGVSAPQPFGLSIEKFLKFFYYIAASGKIVSFDIAEVSPPLDNNNQTSALAAHIIFRLIDKTAPKLNF